MKVYKVELMVIDFDDVGVGGVKSAIEGAHYDNHCIHPEVRRFDVREIGPWSDDHPLNHADTMDAEYRRLFSQPAQRTEAEKE